MDEQQELYTQEEQEKLERLRAKLAAGKAQADRGEFADYSLEKLKAKLDKEFLSKKS